MNSCSQEATDFNPCNSMHQMMPGLYPEKYLNLQDYASKPPAIHQPSHKQPVKYIAVSGEYHQLQKKPIYRASDTYCCVHNELKPIPSSNFANCHQCSQNYNSSSHSSKPNLQNSPEYYASMLSDITPPDFSGTKYQ